MCVCWGIRQVPSEVATHCNRELAEIRATQDRLSNAYTAFSAETFELSPSASPSAQANRSLLFSQSPPRYSASLQEMTGRNRNSVGDGADCCADSYSGFTLDALTAPLAVTTNAVVHATPSFKQSSACAGDDDAYCEVGHFFNGVADKENNQRRHNSGFAGSLSQHQRPPQSADIGADYGNFVAFADASTIPSPALALGSRVTAAAVTQFRQLSPSSRLPRAGFTALVSPSQRLQQRRSDGHYTPPSSLSMLSSDDAYGTFESFASTFAGESEELARRNKLALSFSKASLASSTASTASLTSLNSDDTYGSFASLSITKPSLPNSVPVGGDDKSIDGASRSAADYGNFASLTTPHDATDRDVRALSPHPTPLRFPASGSFDAAAGRNISNASSVAQQTPLRPSPVDTDVYGSFAALASSSVDSDRDGLSGRFEMPPTQSFPFEPKVKELQVLSQSASDTALKPPPPQLHPVSSPLVVHAHTAACSALEELNAGMACYQQKQLLEALARFTHAQEVAKATDDTVVEARALGNLGTVYLDLQRPVQAVACYQRCLDITRSIKDAKRERTILNNLVLALMVSEDFDRALACCEVQLEMTTNEINRRKIFSRMSLLREKATRAARERHAAAAARRVL